MQYGSTDYHRQSLRNLQQAVRKTRRLCAVVLDTFGRELVIRREYEVDEKVRSLSFLDVKDCTHLVASSL